MNMANITRILAGSLIALAVLLGIFAWSLSRRAPAPIAPVVQGQASFPVVVASRDLPAGKPIEADALTLRMAPSRGASEFGDAAPLVGRVPLTAIAANTTLTEASLTTGLADAVAPGERAVAVRIDEGNAVGNRVRPGNFVDVFFMLKRDMSAGPGAEAEVAVTQARLLLSRVRVLSFGDATLPGTSDSADAASNATRASSAGGGARTAVLAVRTADIDALTLAEGAGRLVLALRNPADNDVTEPAAMAPLLASLRITNDGKGRAAAGLSLQALAGGTGAQPPKQMPSSPPVPVTAAFKAPRVQAASNDLELIRGSHREKIAY